MDSERLKQIVEEIESAAPLDSSVVKIVGDFREEAGIEGNRAGLLRLAAGALRAVEGSSGASSLQDLLTYELDDVRLDWISCTDSLVPPPPRSTKDKVQDAAAGVGCLIVALVCFGGGVFLISQSFWWLAVIVGGIGITFGWKLFRHHRRRNR